MICLVGLRIEMLWFELDCGFVDVFFFDEWERIVVYDCGNCWDGGSGSDVSKGGWVVCGE